MRASVVLPTPGGPQKIMEGTRSPSMSSRRHLALAQKMPLARKFLQGARAHPAGQRPPRVCFPKQCLLYHTPCLPALSRVLPAAQAAGVRSFHHIRHGSSMPVSALEHAGDNADTPQYVSRAHRNVGYAAVDRVQAAQAPRLIQAADIARFSQRKNTDLTMERPPPAAPPAQRPGDTGVPAPRSTSPRQNRPHGRPDNRAPGCAAPSSSQWTQRCPSEKTADRQNSSRVGPPSLCSARISYIVSSVFVKKSRS